MKGPRTRWTSWLAFLIVGVSLLAPAASADTMPYFKVFGGDVVAGGWIDSGATSCSTADANYQAPTFNPLNNGYKGGILTYATSSRKGASTDFGAFALGLIEGSPSNSYGFFDGPSGTDNLSFSNTYNPNSDSHYWGGYWAGATPQTQCIPDYYTIMQNSPKTYVGNISNFSSLDGQYIFNNGSTTTINSSPVTIASGKNITLFVNGNAYIGANITYAPGYTADNVPKFTLIAKGEIYIDPAVTQLDGLYIAEPTSSANNGNIWTCHDSSNSAPDGTYIKSNCTSKLTINGALIAKNVNFLRVNGSLSSAPANESSGSPNIAEVINYTPEMVIGGPFFSQTTNTTPTIESLISLPPVF